MCPYSGVVPKPCIRVTATVIADIPSGFHATTTLGARRSKCLSSVGVCSPMRHCGALRQAASVPAKPSHPSTACAFLQRVLAAASLLLKAVCTALEETSAEGSDLVSAFSRLLPSIPEPTADLLAQADPFESMESYQAALQPGPWRHLQAELLPQVRSSLWVVQVDMLRYCPTSPSGQWCTAWQCCCFLRCCCCCCCCRRRRCATAAMGPGLGPQPSLLPTG